jgi:tRNA dimethylallyltransferase
MTPAQKSRRPILIAGPTASGKSALALALAGHVNGVIVNADSMQVYAQAPILTAQPSSAEQAQVPHRLYGHVPGAEAYSAGQYVRDVQAVLVEIEAAGKVPVVVGGTGLYFKALLDGLSPVPPIPHDVRARVRAECQDLVARFDRYAVWQRLMHRDPAMASRLNCNDLQRVTRALEVWEATGKSLNEWQFVAGAPAIDGDTAIMLVIDRPREDLQARAEVRFDQMMRAGALDEMRALAALELSPELPLMRALGVRPLLAHLAGTLSRDDAIAAGKLETRQYIKRQQTWLNRHMMSWNRISTQQMGNIAVTFDAIVQVHD